MFLSNEKSILNIERSCELHRFTRKKEIRHTYVYHVNDSRLQKPFRRNFERKPLRTYMHDTLMHLNPS